MPAWAGSVSLSVGVGLAIMALVANAIAHASLGRLLNDREGYPIAIRSHPPTEPKGVQAPVAQKEIDWIALYYPMMVHQPLSERLFVAKSPQELTGFFKDLIDVQAEKLIQPYIGKWLKISGQVSNASHHADMLKLWQVFVFVKNEDKRYPDIQIALYFSDTWTERLSLITRDTNITVQRRINKVSSHGLELHACELVA